MFRQSSNLPIEDDDFRRQRSDVEGNDIVRDVQHTLLNALYPPLQGINRCLGMTDLRLSQPTQVQSYSPIYSGHLKEHHQVLARIRGEVPRREAQVARLNFHFSRRIGRRQCDDCERAPIMFIYVCLVRVVWSHAFKEIAADEVVSLTRAAEVDGGGGSAERKRAP